MYNGKIVTGSRVVVYAKTLLKMDIFYMKIMNFKHNFFNSGMFSNNRNILFIRQIPTVKQKAWVADFVTLRY